jgi:hypothetical protein
MAFRSERSFPDFRIRSWHLRGLRDASPRINFGSPLIANRLFFTGGVEYNVTKTPVRTLPFPFNESKTESVNSISQFDYFLSANHFMTGTLQVTPQHTNFVDPQFFSPQPVIPSFRAFNRACILIDQASIGKGLLESTLGAQAFDARVGSQGSTEMTLTPTGFFGNYFSTQSRNSGSIEWLETFSRSLSQSGSVHNLKFGSTIALTSSRGLFAARADRHSGCRGTTASAHRFQWRRAVPPIRPRGGDFCAGSLEGSP